MATKNLLNLPCDDEQDEDDTFTRDLLRQFDKKRSRLHYELGFISQEPSPEPSIIQASFADQEPIQLDDEDNNQTQLYIQSNQTTSQFSYNTTTTSASKRLSSMKGSGNLLRRSSAYLKSKFDLLRSSPPQQQLNIDSNKSPTKVLMKTTITIPTAQNNTTVNRNNNIPTTIIAQYPPKPLVYSPIEPIPNSCREDSKPLLHRISMPLIRVYNDGLSRNRSMTSFGRRRKSEPQKQPKTTSTSSFRQ